MPPVCATEPLGRRAFGRLLLQVLCLRGLFASAAASAATGERRIARAWLADLADLCDRVKAHAIAPEAWQDGIAALYRRHPLDRVLAVVDLPRVTRGLDYPDDLAVARDVPLPVAAGAPRRVRFGHKVFALRRGASVIPHAHNNMVSAHLVLAGTFHVRTFQRRADRPGHLVLAPGLDRSFGPGEVLTMSDERDNVHWLVATSDHAFTFDTPVVDLTPGRRYATAANAFSMIHVDPTVRPGADGLIHAPVISFEEARRRFGRGG